MKIGRRIRNHRDGIQAGKERGDREKKAFSGSEHGAFYFG
jgi:hypothetical protein